MRLEDLFVTAVFASAITLIVTAATARRTALARAFRGLSEQFRQLRPWMVLAAAFGLLLLYTFLDDRSYRVGYFHLLVVVGVVVGFTVAWVREFLFLMALRDEDLPGRFDKPIWAAVLIVLAPLGLFLFRSHRLAHWPEPEPKPGMAPDAARELI